MKWMEPLTSAWIGVTRNYRGVGVAEAMTGAKLTEIVCKHMRKLFTVPSETVTEGQSRISRTHAGSIVC